MSSNFESLTILKSGYCSFLAMLHHRRIASGTESPSGVEEFQFTAGRSLPLLQAWSLGYKYSLQLALRIFQDICGWQEKNSYLLQNAGVTI